MIKTPLSTVIGGAFWTPGATVINGAKLSFEIVMKKLFANGEQGFYQDPYDLGVMYQDSAGTTAVDATGQPLGLVLDKRRGLELGPELLQDTSFNNPSYWVLTGTGVSVANGNLIFNAATTASSARREAVTVLGRVYAVRLKVESITGILRVGVSQGTNHSLTKDIRTAGEYFIILRADGDLANFYIRCVGVAGTTAVVSEASLKEIQGNHAYQTTSAARPILQDTPRRIDFDTVDDKLITNLPAQLTGCTVVRSVPGVGVQLLTNQTIPATYEDNTDHCGLIVINRALTPSETSAIAAEFNKRAGV